MTTTERSAASALSDRTRQTYAQDWALFTDWCAATGHHDLPANPGTVLRFLADCPATQSTQRCRVAAIDHHHRAAGALPPGRSAAVLAALGRPTAGATPGPAGTITAVQSALRSLPSHGWTRGMFGRRDRCLLVLSQLAGVPYTHLAHLTVSSVRVADGAASVATAAGAITLTPADDALICGPCAVVRWLRVIDVVMTTPSHRVLAHQIADADPVTDRSPHLCRSTRELSTRTLGVPLLPPIDQWGYVPFPLQRLTPHSLSRLVHRMLAGDLVGHRHIPVDDQIPEPTVPPPAPAAERVYSRDDAQRAWARRRAGLKDIAGVDRVLVEIDARATELEQRTAEVLAQNTPEPDRRNPLKSCPTPCH